MSLVIDVCMLADFYSFSFHCVVPHEYISVVFIAQPTETLFHHKTWESYYSQNLLFSVVSRKGAVESYLSSDS